MCMKYHKCFDRPFVVDGHKLNKKSTYLLFDGHMHLYIVLMALLHQRK